MTNQYTVTPSVPLPTGNLLAGIGALCGISVFCILEVIILIINGFENRRGIYFWSIFFALIGTIIFNVAIIIYFFGLGYHKLWLTATLFAIGYVIYIPAEFLVLYSRLHLLAPDRRIMRFVLILISAECLLITIPTCITSTGSFVTTKTNTFDSADSIMGRVEPCVYAAVEITISCIYL